MTIEELEQAVRELTTEVARLSLRVRELEQQIPDPLWAEKAEAEERRRYQADQELSAHLNGMSYP